MDTHCFGALSTASSKKFSSFFAVRDRGLRDMSEPEMCYNITLLWGQREHLLFGDPQLDLVYV